MLFYFAQNTINGGGVKFYNSGHRLAFGHVIDMRCLEKVHAFLFVWFDSLHSIHNLLDIGTGLPGLNQC